jgi:hypothetical protein
MRRTAHRSEPQTTPNRRQEPCEGLRLWLPLLVGLAVSCGDGARSERAGETLTCEDARVRQVVEGLGQNLKRVSLLAPDSVAAREIRRTYAPYITTDLLEKWAANPSSAPGREASSPWPERIEVRAAHGAGPETCHIEADIVYASSAQSTSDIVAHRAPVTLLLRREDDWRVSGFDAPRAAPDSTSAAAAADVLRRYYAAINARDFANAYALWENNGAASGQTLEQFTAGFAQTARSAVDVGEPSRIEGAAGSRYVKVPVVVRATTTRGDEQRFEGTYTLRRTVVDGAAPAARYWHIYAADLVPRRSRVPR